MDNSPIEREFQGVAKLLKRCSASAVSVPRNDASLLVTMSPSFVGSY
jgi:hypothetical protein